MSLERFLWCIVGVLMGIFIVRNTPARNCPRGFNVKKIKLKYLWFLFYEDLGENYKTKEVSLSVFVFQLIGYIINFLALIAVIVFYCLNIDISEYLLCFVFVQIIVAFFFAVAMSRIYK